MLGTRARARSISLSCDGLRAKICVRAHMLMSDVHVFRVLASLLAAAEDRRMCVRALIIFDADGVFVWRALYGQKVPVCCGTASAKANRGRGVA